MSKAIAHLVSATNPDAKGNVYFSEEGGTTKINIKISGIPAGEHGFHVHEFGDLTSGCTSAGPHFNPYKKKHGAPTAAERHVGDLGNVVVGPNGEVETTITDSQVTLSGPNSVVGRAIVVHANKDDLGLTNHPDSLTTGNAGDRILCGIIGFKNN